MPRPLAGCFHSLSATSPPPPASEHGQPWLSLAIAAGTHVGTGRAVASDRRRGLHDLVGIENLSLLLRAFQVPFDLTPGSLLSTNSQTSRTEAGNMVQLHEQYELPRDFEGFGIDSHDCQWPGGARIAVSFVLNYEEGLYSPGVRC